MGRGQIGWMAVCIRAVGRATSLWEVSFLEKIELF